MEDKTDNVLRATVAVLCAVLGFVAVTRAAEETTGAREPDLYTVPGETPPGGRLTFTYRPESPLPQRSDGRFETSVSVVGLEQAG